MYISNYTLEPMCSYNPNADLIVTGEENDLAVVLSDGLVKRVDWTRRFVA